MGGRGLSFGQGALAAWHCQTIPLFVAVPPTHPPLTHSLNSMLLVWELPLRRAVSIRSESALEAEAL